MRRPDPTWGGPAEDDSDPAQPPPPAAAADIAGATVLMRNPITDAASLPFQYNANPGFGPNKVTRNILNIQPLIPVTLNEKWSVVVRPVVPIIWQDAPAPGRGGSAGLGDSNVQFYFAPRSPGKWAWGLGLAILLPTATDRTLGGGKWGAGPAAAVLRIEGHWLDGALIGNVWSFGHNDRPGVNRFGFEPSVTYVLPKGKGWYLTSNPLLTANWEAAGSHHDACVLCIAGFVRAGKGAAVPTGCVPGWDRHRGGNDCGGDPCPASRAAAGRVGGWNALRSACSPPGGAAPAERA